VPDDRYGGSDAITFVATVTIKPEHEEEYLALAAAMVELILANEPDTTLHTLHKHPTEPHTYVAVERYRDAEAVRTHAASPYFVEAMGKLQQCLAKPIEFLQLSQIVPS
jgi:(4S)-4-hydroxy-5-phosphonooxypentane-2,3-dione isomerase